MFVSNNWRDMLPSKIGIAPRMVPICMAIDNEHYAVSYFVLYQLHHGGDIFRTEHGVTYYQVGVSNYDVGVHIQAFKLLGSIERAPENTDLVVCAHGRDKENPFIYRHILSLLGSFDLSDVRQCRLRSDRG